MLQKQEKLVEKQCTYHNKNVCILACFNKACQNSHLLCAQCLQENKHSDHNNQLKSLFELTQYINSITKECDDFMITLQNIMDVTQNKMNQLKQSIRQKYQLSEGAINCLDSRQISQALWEMLKWKTIKGQFILQITTQIGNFNQILENCYNQLNLNQVSYLEIRDDQVQQAQVLYETGYQLYLDQNSEEAIKLLSQSLNLNPNNDLTLWCTGMTLIKELGECLRLQYKYVEALTWIDKALLIDPDNFNSLFSKGDCLRMLGKYSEALIWLEKALDIDPEDVSAICSKGACLKQQEKYEEAIIWYDKALVIEPNNQFAQMGKEFSLQKLGEKKQQ